MRRFSGLLNTIYLFAFLITETVLFIFIEFVPNVKNILFFQYSAICLCLITGLIALLRKKRIFNLYVFLALLFTLVADTFLVLLSPYLNYAYQCIAMAAFSVCQIFYMLAILTIKKSKQEMWINLISRLSFLVVLQVVAFFIIGMKFDLLVPLSVLYFSQLICNIVLGFFHVRSYPLLAFGLLLFLGCDIFIGLGYLSNILGLPADHFINVVVTFPFNFAWLFYLPSQILLSLSGHFSVSRRR